MTKNRSDDSDWLSSPFFLIGVVVVFSIPSFLLGVYQNEIGRLRHDLVSAQRRQNETFEQLLAARETAAVQARALSQYLDENDNPLLYDGILSSGGFLTDEGIDGYNWIQLRDFDGNFYDLGPDLSFSWPTRFQLPQEGLVHLPNDRSGNVPVMPPPGTLQSEGGLANETEELGTRRQTYEELSRAFEAITKELGAARAQSKKQSEDYLAKDQARAEKEAAERKEADARDRLWDVFLTVVSLLVGLAVPTVIVRARRWWRRRRVARATQTTPAPQPNSPIIVETPQAAAQPETPAKPGQSAPATGASETPQDDAPRT